MERESRFGKPFLGGLVLLDGIPDEVVFCHPIFQGEPCFRAYKDVAIHDTLCPEIGHRVQTKKAFDEQTFCPLICQGLRCFTVAPKTIKREQFVPPLPKGSAFWRTLSKRSQNAQPQNEILCSKGAWGRCPQQADGRKCECVLTLALLAGNVCG